MLGSRVIRIKLRGCSENSKQEMNKGNKISRLVTVFCEPRRQISCVIQREC